MFEATAVCCKRKCLHSGGNMMRPGSHLLAGSIVLLLLLSCGADQETAETTQADEPVAIDTLLLSVQDTLGVEFGDSSYVFASLMQVGHDVDGNILVLDLVRNSIDLYSGFDLTHMGSIGRSGPGPGEYEFPLSFAALSEGGLAVSDMMARNVVVYGPGYSYIDEMQGFGQNGPPSGLIGGAGNTIVGNQMRITPSESGIDGSLLIGAWSTSNTDPEVIYTDFPVEVGSEGGGISVIAPTVLVAAGPDGSIFIAESSDSVYLIEGYLPNGEPLVTISRDWERVPKSEEEMEEGMLGLSIMMDDGGTTIDRPRIEDEDPYRPAIYSIGVDVNQNIWVRVGSSEKPTFHVYDYEGNMLFVAVLDELGTVAGRRARFVIDSGGILGFDPDPEDYPKVYIVGFPRLED
jgi:hypothetical protein